MSSEELAVDDECGGFTVCTVNKKSGPIHYREKFVLSPSSLPAYVSRQLQSVTHVQEEEKSNHLYGIHLAGDAGNDFPQLLELTFGVRSLAFEHLEKEDNLSNDLEGLKQ